MEAMIPYTAVQGGQIALHIGQLCDVCISWCVPILEEEVCV